jgi:Asp-tRNA(Asn)/Glu-tRNA(Gln) amidotransferase A subunit family amidase
MESGHSAHWPRLIFEPLIAKGPESHGENPFAGILNFVATFSHCMTSSTLLSARQIAEQILSKAVSPVEVARVHLDRIERLNPKLNAFVDYKPEAVLVQAREAEKAILRGDELGPLHGVPVSIKSSIDVAGHRCEAGTRLRAGHIPAEDAPLVKRLRAAGAVILGVTNTPELLMAWETDNLLYGRTNNPWDLSRTAGGSSGGEAAAIAAGLSAGGVGSDGGGSIRVPAHFCGICGLKPTPGRIPSTGHFPKSGGAFALIGVVGPMARTIEDLRMLFAAMAGWDDGDPCSAPVEVREIDDASVQTINIGFFEGDGRTPVTKETRSAVNRGASLLSSCGFHVEPFRPEGLEEARQLWWDFFGRAGGMILERMILEAKLRGRESELSPLLREFQSWTNAVPAHTGESLLAAWLGRDTVRENILLQMRNYPVLICPTAAIPAFRHGEREWQVESKTVKYLDAWSYCEWFNLLGFPAAVVPMGYSGQGLPIGVQIVGRPWDDEIVLAVAAILEKARGPWPAPPLAEPGR